MKFDDIISEMGEFGPYQRRIYFLTCLVAIPSALQSMIPIFILATPDHRCVLPGMDNDTYESQGQWHKDLVEKSVPWDDDEEDYSYCDLYHKNMTTGEFANTSYECSDWVFSDDVYKSTFVGDLDLVCDDASLSTYINMIYMGGNLVGSLVLGPLSDVVGRKKVLVGSIVGHVISTFATAFFESFWPFTTLRFITAICGAGIFMMAFTIGMELVGPSKRKVAGIGIEFFWSFGLFLMALLAYFIRTWNHLQIAASVPTVLLLSLYFLIPESARWLISKGRYEEAKEIIEKIANGNHVKLTEEVTKFENLEVEGPGEKIWLMFKSTRLLIRCLIIFFNWAVTSMVYYGLSLNVGALSGNIYLNYTLSSVMELCAYIACLLLLDRIGRKSLHCGAMLIAGIACLSTMFPVMFGDDSVEWVTIGLSLIGKFGGSAAFATIWIFSAELFPTVMRNSGMGISSFAARIGSVLAPYIADLGKVVKGNVGVALPLIIFGGASVAAGLMALLLPETMGKELPECVEDAKNFGKKDKKNTYEIKDTPNNEEVPEGKVNDAYLPDRI